MDPASQMSLAILATELRKFVAIARTACEHDNKLTHDFFIQNVFMSGVHALAQNPSLKTVTNFKKWVRDTLNDDPKTKVTFVNAGAGDNTVESRAFVAAYGKNTYPATKPPNGKRRRSKTGYFVGAFMIHLRM
jgi:hypothetical protein